MASDVLKLGSAAQPGLGRTDLGDFPVDRLDAIAGVWMVGKELEGLLWVLLLDDLEKSGQGTRIVTRLVENVSTFRVCLRLHAARIVQQDGLRAKPDPKLQEAAHQAIILPHETAQHLERFFGKHRFAELVRTVPEHHMAFFVRKYAGQFRFVLRGLERSPVHVDEASRQRKRVDIPTVENLELPGIYGLIIGRIGREPVPELIHIAGGDIVSQNRNLFFHQSSILFSHLKVLRHRKEVEAWSKIQLPCKGGGAECQKPQQDGGGDTSQASIQV